MFKYLTTPAQLILITNSFQQFVIYRLLNNFRPKTNYLLSFIINYVGIQVALALKEIYFCLPFRYFYYCCKMKILQWTSNRKVTNAIWICNLVFNLFGIEISNAKISSHCYTFVPKQRSKTLIIPHSRGLSVTKSISFPFHVKIFLL